MVNNWFNDERTEVDFNVLERHLTSVEKLSAKASNMIAAKELRQNIIDAGCELAKSEANDYLHSAELAAWGYNKLGFRTEQVKKTWMAPHNQIDTGLKQIKDDPFKWTVQIVEAASQIQGVHSVVIARTVSQMVRCVLPRAPVRGEKSRTVCIQGATPSVRRMLSTPHAEHSVHKGVVHEKRGIIRGFVESTDRAVPGSSGIVIVRMGRAL